MLNPKQPSAYTTFILSIGYVEERRVGSLIFQRDCYPLEERETAQEAWEVNFSSLRGLLLQEASSPVAPCCGKYRKESPDFGYCPICGSNLFKKTAEDALPELLSSLLGGTLDSGLRHHRALFEAFGVEGWYIGEYTNWSLGEGANSPGIITVVRQADLVLLFSPQEAYSRCAVMTQTQEVETK